MNKFIIIIFILVFRTSILSNQMIYRVANSEKDIADKFNSQNIVENVNNESENATLKEQVVLNKKTDDIIVPKISEKIKENNPVAENIIKEPQKNKPSASKNTYVYTQPIEEVKQESGENISNTPETSKEENSYIQPETTNQEVVQEQTVNLGEEYKINNEMIETIKNVINSNQSEDMKLYGYNIVVDSSIVESTSQFTYTQTRVIDKIKYKFGTIRIYARDYYNNGQFICTQCYII